MARKKIRARLNLLNNKYKYWYYILTTECTLCGKVKTNKERRYTTKPKNVSERYEHEQVACVVHFL